MTDEAYPFAEGGGGPGGGLGTGGDGLTATGTTTPSGKCDPNDPGTVTCGQGECLVTVPACDSHGQPVTCVPGEPAAESCNGADDDCDGDIDEDCSCSDGETQPCYTGLAQNKGVGECKLGSQTCTGGAWGGCAGDVLPSVETCDGKDNDCDGTTDEGDPGGGTPCATGSPGVCGTGTYSCNGGSLKCQATTQPSAETCDGKDNDCDGTTDEGNPGGGGGCNTGQPGPCATGTMSCQGGKLVCQSNVQPTAEVCNDGKDNDCDGQTDENCGCSHDKCVTGNALSASCDSCVAAICQADPYCCNTKWDATCVGEVQTECNSGKCAASCPHSPCSAGGSYTPFWPGCDSPGSCVALICLFDPYCCNTDWDSMCVAEVGTYCGLSCS